MTTTGAYSELTKQVRQKAESTQQLQSTTAGDVRGGVIKPPFDPAKMAELLEINTTHAQCVYSKGRNVAGFGLELAPHPDIEEPDESQREAAEDLWFGGDSVWQVGPERAEKTTAPDVLEMAWIDYEGIGWLALEIITRTDGTPKGLAYVPAMTIRKRDEERGFAQVRGQDISYYGVAGDRYGDDRTFVDAEEGTVGSSVETPANELIFKRNHSPLYDTYGAPDIVPSIPTIHGDDAAREFNIDFFDHNAVPRLAIIVEGGELTADARQDIHDLLHGMKEGDHRTVVLEVEKLLDTGDALAMDDDDEDEPKIRVEPLTVGLDEDASFLDFHEHNEHEVLQAHSTPPIEAGQIKSGAFSTDAQAQRKGFIETVIQPKQEAFAELLFETIHKPLGVTDYVPEFLTRGVDTRLTDAEVVKTKVEASKGVMTVNEVRDELGLTSLDGPAGEMLLAELGGGGGAPGGGPGAAIEELIDEQMAEARESLRREVITEQRIRGASADD